MDDFTSTTAGNALNARVAPSGGTWTTSGDATDLAFADDLSDEQLKRSVASSADGRFARLGSTSYAGVVVATRIRTASLPTSPQSLRMGVLGRYVDASNYLRGAIQIQFVGAGMWLRYLEMTLVQTSGVVSLGSIQLPPTAPLVDTWYRIELIVTAAGVAFLNLYNNAPGNTALIQSVVGTSAALATGGALATGKPGIWDFNGATNTFARYYDDFRVAVLPELDATLYPGQSAELRSDSIIREDAAGVSYAPAPHVGALPRLPVSGLENRPVEIYINASRGDFDQIADVARDNISCRLRYRPCYLFVPD